jgi:hypothetical protein
MQRTGMGFGTVLFLIFMTLKLTHYIDWSWWFVTAPLWLPAAIILVPIMFFGFIALILGLIAIIND